MSARSLLCFVIVVTSFGCDETPSLDIPEECNPLASTDECLFPYPSRFFQAPDSTRASGYRNAFHETTLSVPAGSPLLDYEAFNRADGHSPTAPLLVHLGVDVDPAQLVGQYDTERSLQVDAPIAVFDLSTGERVPLLTEMDQNLRDSPSNMGRHALILRPMVPMRMGARHVAVLTTDLQDASGTPIEVPPGFLALRDGTPTSHAALEAARGDYEELFTFLAEHGYARERLLLAWDFAVASEEWVLGGIVSMRDQALAESSQGGLGFTITEVRESPNANVLRIVFGTFEVPTFINADNEIERTADGAAVLQPTRQSFPFTMVVPAIAARNTPLPLVLFGHGVFGSASEYLAGSIGTDAIQPLAQELGAVVVATDWIGLSYDDRALLIGQLARDINRTNVVTDRLQQALINALILVETSINGIQNDPMVMNGIRGTAPLLSNEVYYYGVSLGGIQGASLVSISPRITRAVLAVPGGAWATLLTRSIVYSAVRTLVDSTYPDALVQQAFVAMTQTRFDGSDGANVGQLLTMRPLPDAPADRRVLLQEAIGDCQVPNVATRILARAMGLSLLDPPVQPVYGLPTVTTPTTVPSIVQLAMPDLLAQYTPPESNLLPATDNGTHSNAIGLPPVIDQVTTMLSQGVIENYCNGACDPD